MNIDGIRVLLSRSVWSARFIATAGGHCIAWCVTKMASEGLVVQPDALLNALKDFVQIGRDLLENIQKEYKNGMVSDFLHFCIQTGGCLSSVVFPNPLRSFRSNCDIAVAFAFLRSSECAYQLSTR